MKNPEYLDICDSRNTLTGKKAPREMIHLSGEWHRTAHIWVVSEKRILLQKRSPSKLIFPDLWDISAAGHIESGEVPRESALRELKEELGIEINPENLVFLKTVREKLKYGPFTDNEHHYVYLYLTGSVSVDFQAEEIQDVKFFSLIELEEKLEKEKEKFVPHEGYWFDIIRLIRNRIDNTGNNRNTKITEE